MQGLKSILITIVGVGLLGLFGWWALRSLEPGDIHALREKYSELEDRNNELEEENQDLRDRLAALEPPAVGESGGEMEGATAPAPASSKYASLIAALQELVDSKIQMKLGSRGTRVGTVQEFLNIYFNANKKIDNDYGKGMKTDVANFQKAVGLPADGEAGPATFQKMIDWLNNNS